MQNYGYSLTFFFQYKERIYDYALIGKIRSAKTRFLADFTQWKTLRLTQNTKLSLPVVFFNVTLKIRHKHF